ncbi:MAG: hypothetical protein KGO81_09935 [Bacteroidota bacterium]|nr:hypothetical protein [Bacteroidota bacterium]
MRTGFLNNEQRQYRILAECRGQTHSVTLAGFSAAEQTESILLRHLQNICILSDGSLSGTQLLLSRMMQQWQNTLNFPQSQVLEHAAASYPSCLLKAVCLYKTIDEEEKLINRISL